MIQRVYDVEDIDRMRRAVDSIVSAQECGGPVSPKRFRHVEERLRTYMMAGILPAQLDFEAERETARLEERLLAETYNATQAALVHARAA